MGEIQVTEGWIKEGGEEERERGGWTEKEREREKRREDS